ncbi:hypothetical protein LOAG_00901 [Loa loa]|uniref:Uncharacterized protein n=1 Tax=Loa loa TaxID=7209 RepID=A0A1S0UC97_LOALO|nr:hypothetical protein LOAG_00901 [Loa loa]EFO27582.1 hypothetical protein LOAG_00901 [Loa loa]
MYYNALNHKLQYSFRKVHSLQHILSPTKNEPLYLNHPQHRTNCQQTDSQLLSKITTMNLMETDRNPKHNWDITAVKMIKLRSEKNRTGNERHGKIVKYKDFRSKTKGYGKKTAINSSDGKSSW